MSRRQGWDFLRSHDPEDVMQRTTSSNRCPHRSGVHTRLVSKRVVWQMFPCNEISSKKSLPAVLPWQKTAIFFDKSGADCTYETTSLAEISMMWEHILGHGQFGPNVFLELCALCFADETCSLANRFRGWIFNREAAPPRHKPAGTQLHKRSKAAEIFLSSQQKGHMLVSNSAGHRLRWHGSCVQGKV